LENPEYRFSKSGPRSSPVIDAMWTMRTHDIVEEDEIDVYITTDMILSENKYHCHELDTEAESPLPLLQQIGYFYPDSDSEHEYDSPYLPSSETQLLPHEE
jgi:hypothetical protein